MRYETLKESGEYPIVGVNTFLSAEGSPAAPPAAVTRSSEEEKRAQLESLAAFQRANAARAPAALEALQRAARGGANTFEALMDAARVASLGQITQALYAVGGRYRRNM